MTPPASDLVAKTSVSQIFTRYCTTDLAALGSASVILIGWGILIYLNSLANEFSFDDRTRLIAEDTITSFPHLFSLFIPTYNRFFGYMTFALNYWLHGYQVFGYHVINIALHIGTSLLVWRIIVLLLTTPQFAKTSLSPIKEWVGFLSAIIFLTHPIQTQSVSYIIQRFTSLAALWYLLIIWLYLKWRGLSRSSRLRWSTIAWYGGSMGLAFVLGMYSKETVFSLPLMVGMIEVLCFGKAKKILTSPRNWIGLVIGSGIIIGLGNVLFPLQVLFDSVMSNDGEVITWITYLMTQPWVMVRYAQLIFFPYGQSLDHMIPLVTRVGDWRLIVGLSFLTSLSIAGWYSFKRSPILVFVLCWTAIALLIESSVHPLADVMFEHRLYLPMVAISLGLVWVIYHLCQKKMPLLVISVGMLALIYSLITISRNHVWENEEALWKDVIITYPQAVRAHNNLAFHLIGDRRFDEAGLYLRKAIDLNPAYATAYNNLANIFILKKQYAQAMPLLVQTLKLEPGYLDGYNKLASILALQGNFDQAIKMFQQGLAIEPDNSKLQHNLDLTRLKQMGKAVDQNLIIELPYFAHTQAKLNQMQ